MLIEQLIRETLELQEFRVESVEKEDSELLVTMRTGSALSPCCGICSLTGEHTGVLDTLPGHFRHVPT